MANEQDLHKIPGVDTMPSSDPETASALDAALLEATGGLGEPTHDEVIPKGADEKPADEVKPVDEVKPADEVKPVDEVKPAEDDVAPKAEPDELDAVPLPTNIKPKTSEAFEAIKRTAREKIGALTKETEGLKTRLTELEAKTKDGGLTPEIKKELEDLREFRNKLDIEADPKFKDFDKRVEETATSIYEKLKQGGASDDVIKKIKDLGGIEAVEWDGLLAKLPAVTRRSIEAKLVDIETLKEDRTKAIAEAKKNASQYVAARSEQTSKQRETERAAAVKHGEELANTTEWMKEKTIPAKATAAEKKAIEAHNQLVKDSRIAIKEAAQDDSPQMRAALGLGVAELMKTRLDFANHKAETSAQITKLTAELKAATDLLERVKKGSTNRLKDTPAVGGELVKGKEFQESGSDAIDRLAKEAEAGQPA